MRRDGLVCHKRQHQVGVTMCHSALNKGCLLPPLPRPLHPRRHRPRRAAPASLDMSIIHVCAIGFNSQGRPSRMQAAKEVREGGEDTRRGGMNNPPVCSSWTAFCSISVSPGYEDDKVQLPFTVTDLKGRNLQLVTGPHNGQVRVGVALSVAVRLSCPTVFWKNWNQ